ncbi:MAG: cysteine desulfurase NifS [Victivallales bacterium]|nr:cysteine desulfurase NifS [Victivallales bacterium]MCF7889176.1 cysteine desulfurase NifS [Victivallales bacterium]
MDNGKLIYVDNNATTKVDPKVFEAMKPFLTEYYGNPSSIYSFGGIVSKYIDKARKQVADFLGALPEEVVFTSCGTESDSTAIYSALSICSNKNKIVTSKVEHPAVLNLCNYLSERGYNIVEIPVDKNGCIDVQRIDEAIDNNTALVSVMWANNEIGNIYPVNEIAKAAHAKGAMFHTDGVQAAGKIPIDLSKTEIDMLSMSGHKIHAPKGVGALYIRKGLRFNPFLIGGHQENGRRAGTENNAGIVALGRACELAEQNMDYELTEVKKMRDYLESEITEKIPKIKINGDCSNRVPNTTNVSFEGIEGESILLILDKMANIAASSGSACTTGSLKPSHVLTAIGLKDIMLHSTLRISLSRFNTMEEIDKVVETLVYAVKKLRDISPFWKG